MGGLEKVGGWLGGLQKVGEWLGWLRWYVGGWVGWIRWKGEVKSFGSLRVDGRVRRIESHAGRRERN